MMSSHFGEEFYENDVSVVQRKLAAIIRGKKREREREKEKETLTCVFAFVLYSLSGQPVKT